MACGTISWCIWGNKRGYMLRNGIGVWMDDESIIIRYAMVQRGNITIMYLHGEYWMGN